MPRPPADAPLLTPDSIYAAALRLIDRDGVDALSMRKLAAELNVNPKSLYHHVPNKEALLRGVYVIVLGELELPGADSSWQDGLRRVARSFRDLARRHPSFISYFFVPHEPAGRELDAFEALYALYRRAGLPDDWVLPVGRVLITFLTGFILAELRGALSRDTFAAQRKVAQEQPERYPNTLQLPLPAGGNDPDASFGVALNFIIAGLESEAAQPKG